MGLILPGTFGGFNFGMENNLSMKVRNKKDTGENALKKISILDAFKHSVEVIIFSQIHLKFHPFHCLASTNLFNKVNLTASASFDPYEVNSQGSRINQLIGKKIRSHLGRLTNANISLSSHFREEIKKQAIKAGVKPN